MKDAFDTWFDEHMDRLVDSGQSFRDSLREAYDHGIHIATRRDVVNGNARMVGFGAPAVVIKPKREVMPDPKATDALLIKHWNIWDRAKSQFAATGISKTQAFYWADRYNAVNKTNSFFAVPVMYDQTTD